MASSNSTIGVTIIGNTRGLNNALKSGQRSIGGFAKSISSMSIGTAGVIGLALLAADKTIEFLGAASKEGDRLGDSTTRLNLQLGKLAKPLEAAAGGFDRLGQSRQDMQELEANFADLAIAAGIGRPKVAKLADDVAATAAAAALLGKEDPSTVAKNIGLAAGGSAKAMRALGVRVSEAAVKHQALADTGKKSAASLTKGELATARLELVLKKLRPKLDDATKGTGDLEQKQKTLGARIESLQGEIGTNLNPIFANLVTGVLTAGDAIGQALTPVLAELGTFIANVVVPAFKAFLPALAQVGSFIFTTLTPIGLFTTHLREIGDFIRNTVVPALGQLGNFITGTVIPALQGFGTFIQTTVLPALGQVGAFIQTTVLPALGQIGAFLTANVLPLLQNFANFILTTVVPALSQVAAFILSNVGPALSTMGGILRNTVVPFLGFMGDALRNQVLPFLQGVGGFIRDVVVPFMGTMGDILRDTLVPFLQQMGGVLQTVLLPPLQIFGTLLTDVIVPFLGNMVGVVQSLLAPLGHLADIFNTLSHIDLTHLDLNPLDVFGGGGGGGGGNPPVGGRFAPGASPSSERTTIRTLNNFGERNGLNLRIGTP